MWCKIRRSQPRQADKTSAFYSGTKSFSHPAFDNHGKSKEQINIVPVINNRHASHGEISSRPQARW